MRVILIPIFAMLVAGCAGKMQDDPNGVPFWAPSFVPPKSTPSTRVSIDGASGSSVFADRSRIKAPPAQELFDPANPKPSFVPPKSTPSTRVSIDRASGSSALADRSGIKAPPAQVPTKSTPSTRVYIDGASGSSVFADRSGIKAPPAQELFDPAYPKPSFVQPSELANRNTNAPPAEAGSPTVYPTRGQAAESTGSPTLYPPSGRFNTEPGNPSLYPRGPVGARGFRGQ